MEGGGVREVRLAREALARARAGDPWGFVEASLYIDQAVLAARNGGRCVKEGGKGEEEKVNT